MFTVRKNLNVRHVIMCVCWQRNEKSNVNVYTSIITIHCGYNITTLCLLVFTRLDEDGKVLTPEELLYRVSKI